MDFKLLQPEYIYYSFGKIEKDGYWIETNYTIMGSVRVTLRKIDEDGFYKVNWCCGENLRMAYPLINILLHYIEHKSDISRLPTPEIRPYFRDRRFLKWVTNYIGKEDFGQQLEGQEVIVLYLETQMVLYTSFHVGQKKKAPDKNPGR